jgi:hypothetical protein
MSIQPTAAEKRAPLPGDAIVPQANVIMDRAFSLAAPAENVWPWLVQLGKNRAGWYFPRWVEVVFPSNKRALRSIDTKLQNLKVGDIIDDWGGKNAKFETAEFIPGRVIVYKSTRGNITMSWAIVLNKIDDKTSRVHLRLRLDGIKHGWLAKSGGGLIDFLTVAGLAAGLRERLRR